MNSSNFTELRAIHPSLRLERDALPQNITVVITILNQNPYPDHSSIERERLTYLQSGKVIDVTLLINNTP